MKFIPLFFCSSDGPVLVKFTINGETKLTVNSKNIRPLLQFISIRKFVSEWLSLCAVVEDETQSIYAFKVTDRVCVLVLSYRLAEDSL